MSKLNKLQKFAQLSTFPNVYEVFDTQDPVISGMHGEEVELKGQWHKAHFKNDNPITLELACGRGEYSVGLAQMHPNRNFIGIDIKGARIWKGAKRALDLELNNVAFLRTRIEIISTFFEKGEIDEIWIIFPDPFLKKGKANRRLTSPRFLNRFREILKPGGLVHLKTDSPLLYDYTLEVMETEKNYELLHHEDDIYSKEKLYMPELEIKTFYEHMHLEDKRLIKYVRLKSLD